MMDGNGSAYAESRVMQERTAVGKMKILVKQQKELDFARRLRAKIPVPPPL